MLRHTARPFAFALTLLALSAQAQPAVPADELKAMLAEVSPARIEARIRKLVSFGTRHTLSDIASDTRGIGAARRWITAELTACSKAAGGRLQVEEQSFIEPAGNRVSQPTELVNVVATLPGRGASKSRVLVVSGHYDSRNSDVMDSLGEAPGANDDASGTAAVMELACVMARRQFDATLVFMAVPGEEQGLLGAAQWAREARAAGTNVEAMITNDIIGSSRGDAGQVEHLARPRHRQRQVGRLAVVHAAPQDRHEEGGGLVVGDVAPRVALDKPLDFRLR